MNCITLLSVIAALSHPAEGDTLQHDVCLDEVEVVSTIKENQSMRQLPMSATSLSSNQMTAAQVRSVKGISGLVPNFFMPDYGSRLTSAIYIRGIGSRINTPAVGLYVDNMPYADKSGFDFNFYGIERVDVLRGPQGTLYGRNAMGGLVRIYTKNPFAYEGTDLQLGYASGDHHRSLSATHYHRVGERFAFSGGGYYEGGSGFFRNTTTGHAADAMNAGGARLRGIYRASERLSLDFTANYDFSKEGAYPYFYVGSLADPSYEAASIGQICNNRDGSYRRSLLNAGANLEYRWDKAVLNAVTSYQHLRDRMFMDQDFLKPDIYTLEQRQRIHTISEELTLKDRGAHKRWHWVSGLNLMYQALHTEGPVTFYADGINWLTASINAHLPSPSAIPSMAPMGFSTMAVNLRDQQLLMGGTFSTPTLNLAAFHQSTLTLTPRLTATLGIRLNYEHLPLHYDAPATVNYGFLLDNTQNPMMRINLQNLTSPIDLYHGTLKRNYLKVLPKVALQYDFPSGSNIYASVAEGQRSGGYNVQMFSDLLQGAMQNAMMKGILSGVADYLQQFTQMGMPSSVINSVTQTMAAHMPIGENPTVEQVVYRPEYSWNFEVGTHLNLLERHLQMDAALFLINTRDQQIARFAPSGFGRMMVNAGRSRSMGGELTALWRPDQHWALSATYGYTHARFTDYDANDGHDYTGHRVPFVPEHTLRIDASHTWQISRCSWLDALTLGADYRGAGPICWTEANDMRQRYYSLLGARLSLATRWGALTLWGSNLTATRYTTFCFESASRIFEQHGRPIQCGLTAQIRLAK